MTKRADNQGQQLQDSAIQGQTPWQRIYAEYKKNTAGLKEKYARELNREIISKQSKDTYSLANIFKNIANENIRFAQKTDTNQSLKLYHYNDAAIACQYTLKLTEDPNLQQDTYKILDVIQTDMVKFCGGDVSKIVPINSKQDIEILCHRKELQEIRDQSSKYLEQIEKHRISKKDELYINESATIFKDIASSMQQYLRGLYKFAEDIIGLPPCNYAVIGLGSMALRQMTPYSDLECAILTENEGYKHHDNPAAIRNYFTNLSHLVHFKIINLGETIIPTSAYNINLSEFVFPAVNFDLGGKTPLGRIEKDKPYELIQTVDGMLSYLQNPFETSDHVDKNLASILQKVCFIHGSEKLAKSYQEQAQDFLAQNDNGRPNHEERAIKALLEGVEEIDYTKSTLQPKRIEGNLEQFSLNANKTQGKLFDVKQEIYRMPDRFIYNLGLIYGVQEDSSWDTIDKLYDKGIINSEGAYNLKKALSFATNLRLKTYSHYGCQKDSMDYAKTYEVQSDRQSQAVEKELTTVFKLTHDDLQEDGALFQYYYTALALRNSLEEFCKLNDLSQKEGFFSNNPFYQTDVGTKAQINSRLLRYKDALKYELEELKELEIKKQDLLDNSQDFKIINLKIAASLDNIATTYQGLGDHINALKCREEELKIFQSLGYNDRNIAKVLGNIGIIYQFLGHHEDALKYKTQALQILQRLLAKKPDDIKTTLDIATTLNNIGMTHLDLGRYVEALEYIRNALEVRKELLDSDHPDIATSLNNVAVSYGGLSNHQQALECQLEGLNIFQKSLGSDHPYVAIILSNIGVTYSKLRDHEKDLEYKMQALEITKKSLGNNHHDIAKACNNIAVSYGYLGHYKEALNYYIQASEIFKQVLGNEHHALAIILNNIGNTYRDVNDHQKALEYKLQALNIFQKSLGSNHVDTITCKYKISQEYCHLGMYKEALAELAGILSIYKKRSNQQDKIVQYSNEISIIKKVKSLYDVSNKLLEDNTIVQVKNAQEIPQVISQLITVRKQFEACSDPIKSDIIDEKILLTLDLVIKAQTSLYQNSTKNKLAIRKQLNEYQKEYDELKKSMDDKQVILAKIEEYLAEQKQIRDQQNEIESAHNALSMLETDSAFEELPENTELLSLMGENHNEHAALNLN